MEKLEKISPSLKPILETRDVGKPAIDTFPPRHYLSPQMLLLPTHGIDFTERFKILGRHLYAFLRHLTLKKLANFFLAEYSLLRHKTRLKSFPYLLKIEPSNICNLHCAYCYDGRRQPREGERPFGRMSFENFKNLVDEVGAYLFKINLYGFGEPFLFPETLDMIRYASRHNIGVATSSNMNFRNPDLPRQIVESGLEVLIFSFHGLSKETYGKFMGNGDPDLALANIRKVVEERARVKSRTPLIDWQFCVTGFNQHEIAAARIKAREIGVDQIRFIKPWFPEAVAEEEWFSDQFPKQAADWRKIEAAADCIWPYRAAFINFDGGLIPCCRDTRLLANDFGNVFEQGFMPIWNNEKYQAARRLLACPQDKSARLNTICSRCPLTRPK